MSEGVHQGSGEPGRQRFPSGDVPQRRRSDDGRQARIPDDNEANPRNAEPNQNSPPLIFNYDNPSPDALVVTSTTSEDLNANPVLVRPMESSEATPPSSVESFGDNEEIIPPADSPDSQEVSSTTNSGAAHSTVQNPPPIVQGLASMSIAGSVAQNQNSPSEIETSRSGSFPGSLTGNPPRLCTPRPTFPTANSGQRSPFLHMMPSTSRCSARQDNPIISTRPSMTAVALPMARPSVLFPARPLVTPSTRPPVFPARPPVTFSTTPPVFVSMATSRPPTTLPFAISSTRPPTTLPFTILTRPLTASTVATSSSSRLRAFSMLTSSTLPSTSSMASSTLPMATSSTSLSTMPMATTSTMPPTTMPNPTHSASPPKATTSSSQPSTSSLNQRTKSPIKRQATVPTQGTRNGSNTDTSPIKKLRIESKKGKALKDSVKDGKSQSTSEDQKQDEMDDEYESTSKCSRKRKDDPKDENSS